MTHDMVHVTDWHNGAKCWSPFSSAEMARRQDLLRASMAAHGVDAMLFISVPSIAWLSGWLGPCPGRNRGLILTPEAATTISPAIDGGRGWRQTFGDNLTYTDWRRDNYWRAVRQLTAGVRRLGLEFDTVSLEFQRLLDAALPGVEMVDMGALLRGLRRVKSPEEVALIRKGAAICDAGARAVLDALREGVAEYELARAATGAMEAGLSALPFVEVGSSASVRSGINTDSAEGASTNRRTSRGEILSLTCTLPLFGTGARLGRTLSCGAPDAASLTLWRTNAAIHAKGLSMIRPGAASAEIGAALNEMYRAAGLVRRRSARVLSHHDGSDLGPELLPGMVLALEPMVMIPERQPGAGGYREQDMILVTETGAEVLSRFPFGPDHLVAG